MKRYVLLAFEVYDNSAYENAVLAVLVVGNVLHFIFKFASSKRWPTFEIMTLCVKVLCMKLQVSILISLNVCQ